MKPLNEFSQQSFLSFACLMVLALIIWFGIPLLNFNHVMALFAQPEKRLYIISFIFLLWLLKFLLLDLDTQDPLKLKDPTLQKKLQALHKRFLGALTFLKASNTQKQHKPLNQLPWYLFLGPNNSGKTTLLANSHVNFILQKQFHQHIQEVESSENVDWWITSDACIIDVPGKYITSNETIKIQNQKINVALQLWRFFLRLIRKHRGKNSINGILIALPLPEIMRQHDSKKYQWMLRHLFEKLIELQKIFPQPLPCYLIITKCDLLAGFEAFFADNTDDEVTQSWGIHLPSSRSREKIYTAFMQRFNSLIKRLNQQLLWRLHQEHDPKAKPLIKDFPLQLERLKECTFDFVKKFPEIGHNIFLQGIYLTSGTQTKDVVEHVILEDTSSSRSIQLFQEPTIRTRAYFIKHFITHQLTAAHKEIVTQSPRFIWHNKFFYMISALIVSGAVFFLGKDFQQGLAQTYAIQNELSEYKIALQQFNNPEAQLIKTSQLLDKLFASAAVSKPPFNWRAIFSFYSNQSQGKAAILYHQALQSLLEPNLRDYLAEFLKNPVNRSSENVYIALKCYLMLNDSAHFQAEFIEDVFKQIFPKALLDDKNIHLFNHITTLLSEWKNIPLDQNEINLTRHYLTALPSLRLGYIILKNLDDNHLETEIDFGAQKNVSIFSVRNLNTMLSQMFTAKTFATIYTQKTEIAAQEAITGNWILGAMTISNPNDAAINELIQQLRITYVTNYVNAWETLLANINLSNAQNLSQLNAQILQLISDHSPLITLLQTFYVNTYFEPVFSSSTKLQFISSFLDKNAEPNAQLMEIFSGLNALHIYIQSVLSAENSKQMAFQLMTERVKNLGASDAITQLHLIASKNPEPLRNWLDKITNTAWHFLMQEAGHYIDLSWQNEVLHIYQTDIASHYPFNSKTDRDLELNKFIHFFGNPGVITNFYHNQLANLIDTSKSEWRWKDLDNKKLPFSDETLHQIQQAMRIHHSFFPNGDNKLYVQFALQPYVFDKQIKTVKVNINDKQIVDESGTKNSHVIAWPSNNKNVMTSVQFILNNQKIINRNYPGEWGWFRLVNQGFENALTHKQTLINLSTSPQAVKYLLFTEGAENPFTALNLQHFRLSPQITLLS